VIWLTTGAMIVLWLSELITDYGLGNGASLLFIQILFQVYLILVARYF
jgi:preprotein translocase subunit SecY